MATINALPGPAEAKVPSPAKPTWLRSNWGVLLAVAVLVAVLWLPTPEGLSIAGHRMLAVLAFAVIVWMTEALDYAVSAIVVAALMAFLLGLSPNPANPKVLLGTSAGLGLAVSGFANTALALVASALFLAAAMTATGLDKRIALAILSRVGAEVHHVVVGAILVGFVMAFLVVNAPQNMVAYGTETFEARDFVRTGLVLTVIALALVMLLGVTYWRWLGYV
jgi:solute carrier family 13 (sodium-dependent dicarboxylate transporter), member 2/3/5